MSNVKTVGSIFILCMLAFTQTALAGTNDHVKLENKFKQYFADVASDVRQASDPSQKREILDRSFQKTFKALNTVERLYPISTEDRSFLDAFRTEVQEKYDELQGANKFERVNDANLDQFSEYVHQDLEQAADRTVTIGLTTLLLAIIIGILLLSH
jgi:hypothetical protein